MEKADEVSATIERWELDAEDSRIVMDALLHRRDLPTLGALLAETSKEHVEADGLVSAQSLLAGFALQALAQHHQRERFRCSSSSLNEFIRKRAKNQNRNDTTRVHVYSDQHGRIAGFFALSACVLELSGLPEAIQKGRPSLPMPATLLGRFAVDEEFAGRGLGRFLLSLALRAAHQSNAIVASAAVVLDLADDASPRAETLYRDAGFVRLSSNVRRMILPLADIDRHIAQQVLS